MKKLLLRKKVSLEEWKKKSQLQNAWRVFLSEIILKIVKKKKFQGAKKCKLFSDTTEKDGRFGIWEKK